MKDLVLVEILEFEEDVRILILNNLYKIMREFVIKKIKIVV